MSAVLKAREADSRYLGTLESSIVRNFGLLATAPNGAARLRELVLTLAVQGKLVRQQASEAPASELLGRMRADKACLTAQGRSGRTRHLGQPSDEDHPFELPHGWVWAGLPEVCYDFGQEVPSGDFTYIDVSSIDNQRACVTNAVQVLAAKNAPSRARKLVAQGTVLYSTVRPYLRNVALVTQEYSPKAIASTAFAVLHPHAGMNGKYLLYYLRSEVFTKFVASKMVGVAYPAINDTAFFQGVIAVPPAAEQARIVARVEELMRLCDALEAKGQLQAEQHARLLSTLLGTLTNSRSPEEVAANWQRVAAHFDLLLDRPEAVDLLERNILNLAVRGKLALPNEADESVLDLLQAVRAHKQHGVLTSREVARSALGRAKERGSGVPQIPAHWSWCVLDDLAVQGPSNGLSPRAVERPTSVRCLSLSATTQGFFRGQCFKYVEIGETVAAPFLLKHGDLLIQRGNSLDYVGIAALYDGEDDAYIYPDLMMRVRLSPRVNARFVHMCLVCDFGRDYFRQNATGTQGTMPKVNQATVRSALIPLPPFAEQDRIVAHVDQLLRLCAELRQRLVAQQTAQSRLADALVESATAS